MGSPMGGGISLGMSSSAQTRSATDTGISVGGNSLVLGNSSTGLSTTTLIIIGVVIIAVMFLMFRK